MTNKKLLNEFKNPGAAYRGKPFWSWNGELEKNELIRQTHVMKEMGFGGYFMHSRAGLITEYLGDDWFDMINAVADESEKIGMEAWLYDEDRWPSGSAGGKVTVDPQYRMKSLVLTEVPPEEYAPSGDDLAVFYGRVDGFNIYEYEELKDGAVPEAREGWKVLRFTVVPDRPSSGYNGTTYIDTMSLKATQRFIELTHEEYLKRCGDRIGRSIKGIFTDEPHRGHLLDNLGVNGSVRTCSLCYTDDFFEEFEKRYGYSARAILPEIYYNKDGRKIWPVKHDIVDLSEALFLERFAKPINDWCIQHGIEFTGHVLHEDCLTNQTVPQGSLMRFYEYMGYPGIDILSAGNRCYWAAKQLDSSCRQLGKKWRLSELYGCTGWQFNFKGHKAVGDWQALFGINLRCPHLSWYTMEGESKRDYPASILHQATYYKDYNSVETYFARFGLMMQQGDPLCDVLVVNPIESVWSRIHIGWARWISPADGDVHALEGKYQQLFRMLANNQIDFDYGDEEMLSRLASVRTGGDDTILKVGKAEYRTVVVAGAETLRSSTLKLLKRFAAKGGRVVFAGEVPGYVDADPSDEPAKLAAKAVSVKFEEKALVKAVRGNLELDVRVTAEGKPEPRVLAQARCDAGSGNVYIALLNADMNTELRGLKLRIKDNNGLLSGRRQAQEWRLIDGARFEVPYTRAGNVFTLDFDMLPGGEHIFVFTPDREDLPARAERGETVYVKTAAPKFEYTMDEPNVLVLDKAEFRLNGGRWKPAAEVLRVDRAVRDLVGIEHRGGGMLQPWYAKLNYTEKYGKLELRFRFDAEKVPEGELFLALERPENWEVKLNGKLLCHRPEDGFWIDNCLQKLILPARAVKAGENVLQMSVEFMRTTNVEAVYLVGDFGVKFGPEQRCILTDRPAKIGYGELKEYNLPFYTGCLTYHLGKLKKPVKGDRLILRVAHYSGSLVKVTRRGDINAPDKIVLGWDPYEADVTDWVNAGEEIDVTLVPSRKNLFGPLHQVPVDPGSTGPGSFCTGGAGWSDDYNLISSTVGKIVIEYRHS
ncbi:MAG: hypothetical protein II789_00150 [Clostridia bacterium]|nr:hypothetical protein [Clostridia bacterium]